MPVSVHLSMVDIGSAITNKVKRLRWTPQDESLLRKLWGTKNDSEVAELLGRTTKSVQIKASEMKVRAEKGLRASCRSGQVTFRWTPEEELILVKNVGHLSIFELKDLLPRRTRTAIERRCYQLGFSPTQGTNSRLQIEQETGYDWRQIRRAADALKQTWKRYGSRKYMITFDQVQDIIEYLKNETSKWSIHYGLDCCRLCGIAGKDSETRHVNDGLCKKCYDFRRHNRLRIVDAMRRGRMMVLTEQVWIEFVCDEPAVPRQEQSSATG